MPQNPPEGYTRVTPYLYYKDAGAALDFITGVFGFTETVRMSGEDGVVNHGEVELDGSHLMLGSPGEGYKSPNELGGTTQCVYVYVDDVDLHLEHARSNGAEVVRDVEDQFYGDRSYGAKDPEGHEWFFATHVRDVSPEEMKAAMSGAQAG
jgi:PhnB protein